MTRLFCAKAAYRLGSLMIVLGSNLSVWANAGMTATPVHVVAEPVGIEDVRITRESLTIDLRPLSDGRAALVEAVYHLQNDSTQQQLDLLFAFGTVENSDYHVTLDEEPITGALSDSKMPPAWWPPKVTPALRGQGTMTYGPGWLTVVPLSFSIVVPSGDSVLSVRYRAAPQYTFARPAMVRQFAYVLAPARGWAGFGGLDLTIHVPDDWSFASTPVLQRDGGVLHGSFDDVPADAIGLTLRPPIASGYQSVKYLSRALLVLAASAGFVLCWRFSGADARHRGETTEPKSPGRLRAVISDLSRAVGFGLLYGILMLGAGMMAAWGADYLFPPTVAELALIDQLQLSDGYASLAAMAGILLLSALAALVGFLIVLYRRGRFTVR